MALGPSGRDGGSNVGQVRRDVIMPKLPIYVEFKTFYLCLVSTRDKATAKGVGIVETYDHIRRDGIRILLWWWDIVIRQADRGP